MKKILPEGITATITPLTVTLQIEASYFMSNGPTHPAKLNRDDLFDDIRVRFGIGVSCIITELDPSIINHKAVYTFEVHTELANQDQLDGFINMLNVYTLDNA